MSDPVRPDPRERFSGRVDAYVRSRPGYPGGLMPLLRREAGLLPAQPVADVGSGTGILTRLFLDAGHEVYAIEPNAKMRAAAEEAFARRPLFRSVDGSAEATTLPPGSVDLAAAGQAFHWFDREAARVELARVLRPPRTAGSGFAEGYEALLRRHGTDYGAVDHKNLGPDVFDSFFRPGPWRRFALPNLQQFDEEGLRARALSSSYTPPPGDPRHAPMMEELSRLFRDTAEDGLVTMEYETTVYIGAVGA